MQYLTQTRLRETYGYSVTEAQGIIKRLDSLGLPSQNVKVNATRKCGFTGKQTQYILFQIGFDEAKVVPFLEKMIENPPGNGRGFKPEKWKSLLKNLQKEQA